MKKLIKTLKTAPPCILLWSDDRQCVPCDRGSRLRIDLRTLFVFKIGYKRVNEEHAVVQVRIYLNIKNTIGDGGSTAL